MKEKKFLKWLAVRSLVILACFVIACLANRFLGAGKLEETMFNLRNAGSELPEEITLEDFNIQMDVPELLRVTNATRKGNAIYLSIETVGNGTGMVDMDILYKETGEVLDSTLFRIEKGGRIIDIQTGNFSGYRGTSISIALMILAFAILLWAGYFKSRKLLGYSYQSIYCIGLAIWVSILAIFVIYGVIRNDFMRTIYGTIADAPSTFMIITFPVMFLFALSLMISNFSLVRHEGFRFTNVLATILSLVMIGSFSFIFGLMLLPMQGSNFKVNLLSSALGIMAACYAILECFLFGAVICGTQAAKNTPDYDKDYIVILGCMIKGDGTLYPLIRARVDRGIRFYKEQLAATGKKAVFVPSGGQGKNEPISEAAAMKRYLLEQGIEPEQILMEDRSKNTRQNMQFSKELIGEDAKAVFSTTNFHVFRSGIISRQVGFEADGMGSPTKWYFWPNAYVREVIGMLSYKWKSLILIFVPTAVYLVAFIFTFIN